METRILKKARPDSMSGWPKVYYKVQVVERDIMRPLSWNTQKVWRTVHCFQSLADAEMCAGAWKLVEEKECE